MFMNIPNFTGNTSRSSEKKNTVLVNSLLGETLQKSDIFGVTGDLAFQFTNFQNFG